MKRIYDERSFEETAKTLLLLNPCVARDFTSTDAVAQFMKNTIIDMSDSGHIGTYGFIVHVRRHDSLLYIHASIEGWSMTEFNSYEKCKAAEKQLKEAEVASRPGGWKASTFCAEK